MARGELLVSGRVPPFSGSIQPFVSFSGDVSLPLEVSQAGDEAVDLKRAGKLQPLLGPQNPLMKGDSERKNHRSGIKIWVLNQKYGKTTQIIHLFIGFSIIFTIHFGVPLFLETPIYPLKKTSMDTYVWKQCEN